jgi:ABC-type lipoprotein release transport system permease subunit
LRARRATGGGSTASSTWSVCATASSIALSPGQLTVVAQVGLAAGALAGLRPARRVARLDVLGAIAAE